MAEYEKYICEQRQKIDFERVLRLDAAAVRESQDFYGITIAHLDLPSSAPADISCPLCQLFISVAASYHCTEGCVGKQLRAYSYMWQSDNVYRRAELEKADHPFLAVNCYCTLHELKEALFCYPKAGPFVPELSHKEVSPSVDFQALRGWLNDCRSNHEGDCSSAGEKAQGLKLIDCYTLEIRAASPSNPYVALSYVWGAARQVGHTNKKANGAGRLTVERLPKVLLDAIEVTKCLGFRYLWCDKYCIDQDNLDEKTFQINQMDKIYKAAELCIIAALGDDENSPLAGVGTSIRQTRPSVVLPGLRIIHGPLPPNQAIANSKWSTRAWTYREAVLSRRRLVFLPDQVYFECRARFFYEGFEWSLDPEYLDKSRRFSPNFRHPTTSERPANWTVYLEHVCRYTKRELTYEEDSIRAFMGILRDCLLSTPIRHLFGIPYIFQPSSENPSTWFQRGLL